MAGMCFLQRRKRRITRVRSCGCFKCSLAATVVKNKGKLKAEELFCMFALRLVVGNRRPRLNGIRS